MPGDPLELESAGRASHEPIPCQRSICKNAAIATNGISARTLNPANWSYNLPAPKCNTCPASECVEGLICAARPPI